MFSNTSACKQCAVAVFRISNSEAKQIAVVVWFEAFPETLSIPTNTVGWLEFGTI
jgi:hypothetical protein